MGKQGAFRDAEATDIEAAYAYQPERGGDTFLLTYPLMDGPKAFGSRIKTNGDIQPFRALMGRILPWKISAVLIYFFYKQGGGDLYPCGERQEAGV